MHWSVIITTLTLTCAWAYLSIIQGMNAVDAYIIVAGSAFLVLLVAFIGLIEITEPDQRMDRIRSAIKTIRSDLKDFLRWIKIIR